MIEGEAPTGELIKDYDCLMNILFIIIQIILRIVSKMRLLFIVDRKLIKNIEIVW